MKKVFKIWNKKTNSYNGSYSRACHDEYEFDSEYSALEANCHGMFHDTDTYEIHEVEISEKLSKKLPPNEKYLKETAKQKEFSKQVKEYEEKYPENGTMKAIWHVSMVNAVKNIDIAKYYKEKPDDKKDI